MKLRYRNTTLEHIVVALNVVTAATVAATFVLLYGFDELPAYLSVRAMHIAQIVAFLIMLAEKTIRFLNALSKKDYIKVFWYDIPLLSILIAMVFGAGRFFAEQDPGRVIMLSLAIYLVLQVVIKSCRSCVDLAASGKNPTRALIGIFVVLIITGAGLLMLPKANNLDGTSFVDALFTSTSATCVTGLIVKDTGGDFSMMGQIVILTLIQLGGLGIVIFGAVIALLLGQAFSVRESVAMQDLLSAQTLGRIGNMIGFIFITTVIVEAVAAVTMVGVWQEVPGDMTTTQQQWFCSIFHSISAFCNAGFSLFDDSLIRYDHSWAIYGVICPLIILGGLGFGVLYNIFQVVCDKTKRLFVTRHVRLGTYEASIPKRIQLQTKIVIITSLILIVVGTGAISLFEHYSPLDHHDSRLPTALFQSVTARTAGFNTIDIATMSEAGKLALIALMFIGGSPGSTAGGIKTVTLVVLIMTAYASLRKRPQVEIFKRSIRTVVVGRAITVVLLFVGVLISVTLALSVTERHNGFAMMDIMFESASALGTVGLSTGITSSLTTAGKLFIIAAMLIGRLGPLTLLAALTFNTRPAVYDYPSEPVIVG